MRILEIGEGPYVSTYAPAITDFYSFHKQSPPKERLSLGNILRLRRQLRAGAYDLVVYHNRRKTLAPWHRRNSLWRVVPEIVLWTLFSFHRMSWHLFHFFLRDTATPLVVVDTQDVPRITRTELDWLDRCQFWFMRELPPNRLNLFLGMDSRSGDVVNIQRREKVRRNLVKIQPFSLGFDSEHFQATRVAAHEKIHDIFYLGRNHTTTVRQQGMEELRALRAAGFRVHLPEHRLSRPDFFRECAKSWLVWSPEGQGWDCHRHYEVLMHDSVPVINLPTIERLWPFHSGEHCLYYHPGQGGLTDAVVAALKDRDALLKIAGQGRAHILAHHRRSDLVRHILSQVGLLDQAAPHILDF